MKNEVKENTQKKENIEYKAQIRKVCPMCEREVILCLTRQQTKELEEYGGRLTGNGAWTIWDAMNDLFEELEVDWKDIIILDHDRVKDWIESGGEK